MRQPPHQLGAVHARRRFRRGLLQCTLDHPSAAAAVAVALTAAPVGVALTAAAVAALTAAVCVAAAAAGQIGGARHLPSR